MSALVIVFMGNQKTVTLFPVIVHELFTFFRLFLLPMSKLYCLVVLCPSERQYVLLALNSLVHLSYCKLKGVAFYFSMVFLKYWFRT